MPIACDANGFKLASSNGVNSQLSLALYGLFISAVIGLLIGVALLLNKGIPVIADWIVIGVCVCCGMIPYFINLEQYGRFYQSGVNVILIGYVLIIAAQVISFVKKE